MPVSPHSTPDLIYLDAFAAPGAGRTHALAMLRAALTDSPRRQRRPRQDKAERINASAASAILGLKIRKLQAMSQRGEIPGAAKIGRQWTYDPARLRRFIAQQETTCASG